MSISRSSFGSLPKQAVGVANSRKTPFGIKAVGTFVPRLTAKAFQKYGFSAAGLITDWPAIVGGELATCTAPERLKWQPRPNGEGEEDTSPRRAATLVLRVDGARALDVQYRAQQIIERVNGYFGYRAIAELRIVQAPVAARSPARQAVPPGRPRREPITTGLAGVADAALREALARLGGGIRAGR
jgi:hypothetical protein